MLSFVPARPLVLLFTVPLVLAALYPMVDGLLAPLLAANAAIIVLATIDGLWALRPQLRARVAVPEVMSLGIAHRLELRIESLGARDLRVQATLDVFTHCRVEGLPMALDVPAGQQVTGHLRLVPLRRGRHHLGDIHLRYPSPLRLWQRQQNLRSRAEVRVYPDVTAARKWEMWATEERRAGRTRRRPRVGGENEFEQLRSYSRDDEFRAIDWRATARRGQLIARQYQVESGQNLWLLLDSGRLMTAEVEGLSLYDHALNAGLMLAHVATRTGDRVGLLSYADEVRRFVPAASGKAALNRIVASIYSEHPCLEEADHTAAARFLSSRVRNRSLVILFSQVIDNAGAEALRRSIQSLTARHLPLLVLFRDRDVEAMLRPGGDGVGGDCVYRLGAAAELVAWQDGLVRTLRASGVLVLEVSPRGLTVDLVNQYLEIKARHLL